MDVRAELQRFSHQALQAELLLLVRLLLVDQSKKILIELDWLRFLTGSPIIVREEMRLAKNVHIRTQTGIWDDARQ